MEVLAITAVMFSIFAIFLPGVGLHLAILCSVLALISFRARPTISLLAIGINIINTAFLSPTIVVGWFFSDFNSEMPEKMNRLRDIYWQFVSFHVILLVIALMWLGIRGAPTRKARAAGPTARKTSPVLQMVLKLLPGFLAGQWTTAVLWMFLGTLFLQESALNILLPLAVIGGFVIVSVMATSVRQAWGRCLFITSVLCFAMPLLSAALLGQFDATGTESSQPMSDHFVGQLLASVGPMISTVAWLFLGFCFLFPSISLLRQPDIVELPAQGNEGV